MPLPQADSEYLSSIGLNPNEYDLDPTGSSYVKRNVQPATGNTEFPQPKLMPESFGPTGTAVGTFLHEAPSAAAGGFGFAKGAQLGARLGARGGPWGVGIGGLTGGVAGGLITGGAARQAQEFLEQPFVSGALDPTLFNIGRILLKLRESQAQHPTAALAGNIATMPVAGMNLAPGRTAQALGYGGRWLTGQRPPPEQIANIANVGLGAALQPAIGIGQRLAAGEPIEGKDVALEALLGALFNKPNVLGRAYGFRDIPTVSEHPTAATIGPAPITARGIQTLPPLTPEVIETTGGTAPLRGLKQVGTPEKGKAPTYRAHDLTKTWRETPFPTEEELARMEGEGGPVRTVPTRRTPQEPIEGVIYQDPTAPPEPLSVTPLPDRPIEAIPPERALTLTEQAQQQQRQQAARQKELAPFLKFSEETAVPGAKRPVTALEKEVSTRVEKLPPLNLSRWNEVLSSWLLRRRGATSIEGKADLPHAGDTLTRWIQDKLASAAIRLGPESGWETLPHEGWHIFLETLQTSPKGFDKIMARRVIQRAAASPEFRAINEQRAAQGRQPWTPEEFVVTQQGVEYVKRQFNLEQETKGQTFWRDFVNHLKVRFSKGELSDADVRRYLNYRYKNDASFNRFMNGETTTYGGAAATVQQSEESPLTPGQKQVLLNKTLRNAPREGGERHGINERFDVNAKLWEFGGKEANALNNAVFNKLNSAQKESVFKAIKGEWMPDDVNARLEYEGVSELDRNLIQRFIQVMKGRMVEQKPKLQSDQASVPYTHKDVINLVLNAESGAKDQTMPTDALREIKSTLLAQVDFPEKLRTQLDELNTGSGTDWLRFRIAMQKAIKEAPDVSGKNVGAEIEKAMGKTEAPTPDLLALAKTATPQPVAQPPAKPAKVVKPEETGLAPGAGKIGMGMEVAAAGQEPKAPKPPKYEPLAAPKYSTPGMEEVEAASSADSRVEADRQRVAALLNTPIKPGLRKIVQYNNLMDEAEKWPYTSERARALRAKANEIVAYFREYERKNNLPQQELRIKGIDYLASEEASIRIVAPAAKTTDGKIYKGNPGDWHYQVPVPFNTNFRSGFVDNKGNFLTRKEALKVAAKADQLYERAYDKYLLGEITELDSAYLKDYSQASEEASIRRQPGEGRTPYPFTLKELNKGIELETVTRDEYDKKYIPIREALKKDIVYKNLLPKMSDQALNDEIWDMLNVYNKETREYPGREALRDNGLEEYVDQFERLEESLVGHLESQMGKTDIYKQSEEASVRGAIAAKFADALHDLRTRGYRGKSITADANGYVLNFFDSSRTWEVSANRKKGEEFNLGTNQVFIPGTLRDAGLIAENLPDLNQFLAAESRRIVDSIRPEFGLPARPDDYRKLLPNVTTEVSAFLDEISKPQVSFQQKQKLRELNRELQKYIDYKQEEQGRLSEMTTDDSKQYMQERLAHYDKLIANVQKKINTITSKAELLQSESSPFYATRFGKVFTPFAPEIERVRVHSPEGAKAAEGLTEFYRSQSRLRGELEQRLIRNLLQTRRPHNFKEFWTQDNPDYRAVVKWLDAKSDGETPDFNLTPKQQEIEAAVRENLIKSHAMREARPELKHYTSADPFYLPHVMSREAATELANNPTSAKSMQYFSDFIQYQRKKGSSEEEAKTAWKIVRGAFTKESHNLAQKFGPIDEAAGIGLPRSMREQNLMDRMARFNRRYARRIAYHDAIERNEEVSKALFNPESGLESNEHTKNVLEDIYGVREHLEAKRNAALGIVRAGMLGPLTGAKDFVSNVFLGMQHQDVGQILPSLKQAFEEFKQNYDRAIDKGSVRYNISGLEMGEGGITQAVNFLQRARDVINTGQGRQLLETSTRIVAFGQGRYLAADALAALRGKRLTFQKSKFLKDFVKDWEKYRETVPDEIVINEAAANYVDSVQGMYDYRGQPHVTMKGTFAPILSLARWNVEKFNNFVKHNVDPARQGNFKPLLMSTLGMLIGGTAVNALVEAATGRKERTPKWKEVAASDEKVMLSAYKLAGLSSMSGYAGIVGDLLRSAMDKQFKNRPQIYNNPLIDGLATASENAQFLIDAMREGDIPAVTDVINQVLQDYFQAYRLAIAHFSPEEKANLEKRAKLRDVKIFKAGAGLPLSPYSSERQNPYLDKEMREFKQTGSMREAATLVPGLIKKAIEDANGDPERLKAEFLRLKLNNYQTMPSPETMPKRFWDYYMWLSETQGPEEASARLQDYIRQNALNKAKSRMIP